MANLRDLAARLTKAAKEIPERPNAVAIQVAKAIVVYLIKETPVDTSQALSNWQVSLGAPNSRTRPPYYSGNQGSTYFESGAQAIAAAYRILESKRPGQSIWISNHLDYISDLNQGSSRQSPGGFVQAAKLIGRKIAESKNV